MTNAATSFIQQTHLDRFTPTKACNRHLSLHDHHQQIQEISSLLRLAEQDVKSRRCFLFNRCRSMYPVSPLAQWSSSVFGKMLLQSIGCHSNSSRCSRMHPVGQSSHASWRTVYSIRVSSLLEPLWCCRSFDGLAGSSWLILVDAVGLLKDLSSAVSWLLDILLLSNQWQCYFVRKCKKCHWCLKEPNINSYSRRMMA